MGEGIVDGMSGQSNLSSLSSDWGERLQGLVGFCVEAQEKVAGLTFCLSSIWGRDLAIDSDVCVWVLDKFRGGFRGISKFWNS